MNTRWIAHTIATVSILAAFACSGDDEPGTNGGGTGGASGGGSGGVGGLDSGGTGGSAGTLVGGTNGGGTGGATAGAGGATAGSGGSDAGVVNMGPMCPDTKPASATDCTLGAGNCRYDRDVCACFEGTESWVCWTPDNDCPDAAPAGDSACPLVGIACRYGRGRDRNDCVCLETGWACDEEVLDEDGGV